MKRAIICLGLLQVISTVSAAGTLGSVIAAGSPCETSVALGLTKQIAQELNTMGIAFAQISTVPKVQCTGGCSGYMQKSALDSLNSITATHGSIGLSSAWRSVAQQFLLYQFKAHGKCGQTNPVATPGTSNHEGGIAIDVPNFGSWKTILTGHGWNYPLPTSDKVHFEFGTGARTYAQKNLMAFQRLWNRHNPTAKISEDGIYGPATANALNKAPCNGWAASVSSEFEDGFLE